MRFVHLVAQYTKVYQYRFSYQGRYSHTYYPDDKTPYGKNRRTMRKRPPIIYFFYLGVVHHDDLLYLLTGPYIAPVFTDKDPERKTVERLTRMWTNFAHTRLASAIMAYLLQDLSNHFFIF